MTIINNFILNLAFLDLDLKKNDWNSKYLDINKENRRLYLYQDLQIKDFLKNVFFKSNVFLYNINIKRTHNKLHVTVLYLPKILSNYKKNRSNLKNEILELFYKDTINCNFEEYDKFNINDSTIESKYSKSSLLKILKLYLGPKYSISIKFCNIKQTIFFSD